MKSSSIDKVASILAEAQRAQFLIENLGPYLEEQREATLARLKNIYRMGQSSEAKLLACAAELCTVDDIENRLRSKISIAENRAKEIKDGSERRGESL